MRKQIIKVGAMLILIITCQKSFSQVQNLYYGLSDEWFYTINTTSDNNLLMVGSTSSFGAGNTDILVVKTNKDGDTLWTKIYGGASADLGFNSTQMTDGGYLICAFSTSWNGGGNSDAYLIRTNSNGDTLWTNSFGGADDDGFNSAIELAQGGNIIACGFTESYGAGGNDIYIVKTNASGNMLWNKSIGAFSDDNMYSMLLTSDGKLLITGSTLSAGAGINDAFATMIDTNGNVLWAKTFGSTDVDEAYSTVETPGGNFLISGSTAFGAGNYDAWLLKIDNAGTLLWNKTYGGAAGLEDGNVIINAPGGNYLVVGRTGSFGTGNDDHFLFNVDSDGNLRWAKAIGGVLHDPGYGVTYLPIDNSIFLCGSTMSFGPGIGFYHNATLIKVDTTGSGTCHTATANVLVSSPAAVTGNILFQQDTGTTVRPTFTQSISGLSILDACGPTGEEKIMIEYSVSVFPNPFHDETRILISDADAQEAEFLLYDFLIREVKRITLDKPSTKIQRGNLRSGIYFYEVRSGNRIIGKGKLVIQD